MTTTFSGDDNTNLNQGEQQGAFGSAPQQEDSPASGGNNEGRASNEDQFAKIQKRLNDSQAFIEQLLEERKQDKERFAKYEETLRALEERANKETSIAEVLEGMKTQQSQQSEKTSQIDPDELVERVKREALTEVQKQRMEETFTRNFQECASLVQQAYGKENVDTKIRQLAEENDLTFEDAIEMARTKPKAFRRLFVPEGTKSVDPKPAGGTVMTSAFQGRQEQKPSKPFHEIRTDKERIAYVNEMFQRLSNNLNNS